MKIEPKVICFDLVDVLHFLWSVAHAHALQEQTRLVWQPYRDSAVLNAIYFVFSRVGYGAPGIAEVTQNTQRIDALTDKYFDELIQEFLRKAADESHPSVLGKWMISRMESRDFALQGVQEIFHDAAEINREIVEGTQRGIERLARIHLASTLALTGISCAIGIGWVGGLTRLEIFTGLATKTSYGIAGAIIKEWNDHSLANAVAVGAAKDSTKQLLLCGAEKTADKAAEKGVHALTGWALRYLPAIKAANVQVERYSVEVGRKLASRKSEVVFRRLAAAKAKSVAVHAGARRAIAAVAAAKSATRFGIPLVFAAYDILDAISDYREEVGE